MTTGNADLLIRVSDQKNGVYRLESVEWCSGQRGGVELGQCDFVTDLVSCALARLGAIGNASLWTGAASVADDVTTVIAWIV